MATGEDVRRLALALECTTEAPHFDRTAFKAPRTYATLAADDLTANIRFDRDEQSFKCLLAPEAFAPSQNAWGRQGWIIATLSALDVAELGQALELAWTHAQFARPRAKKARR